MAVGFTMTFDGVGKDQYEAVMISHVAGAGPSGWCVVDVWESQAAFDQFLADRLGPALQTAGLPEPNVTPFEVYNSHTE